jgi:hypothetical protein
VWLTFAGCDTVFVFSPRIAVSLANGLRMRALLLDPKSVADEDDIAARAMELFYRQQAELLQKFDEIKRIKEEFKRRRAENLEMVDALQALCDQMGLLNEEFLAKFEKLRKLYGKGRSFVVVTELVPKQA